MLPQTEQNAKQRTTVAGGTKCYFSHNRTTSSKFFALLFPHSVMDFFVHADDAYAHFYPWSMWRFHSPVSYWNPAHYGQYVSAVEILFALVAIWVLWKRTDSRRTKQILFGIGGLETIFLIFSLARILR